MKVDLTSLGKNTSLEIMNGFFIDLIKPKLHFGPSLVSSCCAFTVSLTGFE